MNSKVVYKGLADDDEIKNHQVKEIDAKSATGMTTDFTPSDVSEDDTFMEYLLFPIRVLQNRFSKGSVKGSIFTLMSATIGAGVLSLPYAVSDSGVIWAFIQLVACGFLGYYSNMLLVRAADETKKYSYNSLAKELYGPKFEMFVKLIFFFNNWGGIVVYTTLINNLIGKSMQVFAPNAPSWITATDGYFWPPVFTTLVVFPLSLTRELAALRYFALLGFVFIIYLSCTVIGESFALGNFSDNVSLVFSGENLFKFGGIAKTTPVAFFAFMCQVNTLDVYHELQRPSKRRMKKVLRRNMMIVFVIYLLVGTFGYITFANATDELDKQGNILLNYTTNPIPIVIAYILIGVEIMIATPLSVKPTKDSLNDIIHPEMSDISPSERNETFKSHFILVFLITYSQMAVGMFIPVISLGIGFLGTTAYPMISYIFPAMFLMKTLKPNKVSDRREKNFLIFFIVAMSLFAIWSTIVWIIDLVDKIQNGKL